MVVGGVVVVGGVIVGGGVAVVGGEVVLVAPDPEPPMPGLQRTRPFLVVRRVEPRFARAFVQELLPAELTLAVCWAPAIPMPTQVRLIVAQATRPIATCESRLRRLF